MCDLRNRSVIEAIQQAAQRHGIKPLAADLNKAPSTLYAELSPYPDSKAKLGLDDALAIMRLTGDHAGLVLMASAFGYRLELAVAVPNHDDVRDEMLDDNSRVGLFHALIRERAAMPVVVKAHQEAHRELDETLSVYRRDVEAEQ